MNPQHFKMVQQGPEMNGNWHEIKLNGDGSQPCSPYMITKKKRSERWPCVKSQNQYLPVCVTSAAELFRRSLSAGTRYCVATSFDIDSGSSRNAFIRMNGSRPFCVSSSHGFGRASKSLTDPWDKPRTASPNRRWLIENWLRSSFICMQYKLCLLSLSNKSIQHYTLRLTYTGWAKKK